LKVRRSNPQIVQGNRVITWNKTWNKKYQVGVRLWGRCFRGKVRDSVGLCGQ